MLVWMNCPADAVPVFQYRRTPPSSLRPTTRSGAPSAFMSARAGTGLLPTLTPAK